MKKIAVIFMPCEANVISDILDSIVNSYPGCFVACCQDRITIFEEDDETED